MSSFPTSCVLSLSFDLSLDSADSCTERDYIFAGVTDLELIRLAGIVTHRNFSCLNQGASQVAADAAPAVITESRQLSNRDGSQRLGSGIAQENGYSEFGVETAHMASEFREGQVEGLVQMTHSIAQMLHTLFSQAHQLLQLFDCRSAESRCRRSLLGCKTSDAHRIDFVSLCPLQFFFGEASSAKRIEQNDFNPDFRFLSELAI